MTKAIREAILDGQIDNNYEAGFQRMLEEGAEGGGVINKSPLDSLVIQNAWCTFGLAKSLFQ